MHSQPHIKHQYSNIMYAIGYTVATFISVINQLDAQTFCFTISLFHASTCFEHMCSSSGGQNCITQPLCVWKLMNVVSCVISGFRRGVNEIFAVTGMLCKKSKKKNPFQTAWHLTTGPIGCSETQANNYQSALCNILEDLKSQICFHFVTSLGEDLVLRTRYSENAVFIHLNSVITLWKGAQYFVSL